MKPALRRILVLMLALVALPPCPAGEEFSGPVQTSPWTWEGVDRIVALGDTHGAVPQVQELLQGLGLADEGMSWTGGRSHLVFVGDLVDRGPQERRLLDLVIRLQSEAEEAGGRVHVLLGNHEVMNMMQDLRYVPMKGFLAFSDEEDPQVRRKAAGRASDRAAFDQDYPLGYFGRRAAFGPDGYYSNWLLDQQVVIRINGIVFVHGGLTEEIAGMGYEEINRSVKQAVRSYWKWRGGLIRSGKVHPEDDFKRTMQIAAELLSGQANKIEKELASGLRRILKTPAVSSDGPLWYRGTSIETERVERDQLTASLEALGGRAVVLGHSITREGRITSRFGGRVFRADVGMAYEQGGGPQALVFEEGEARVYDGEQGVLTLAAMEPPQGEGFRDAMPPVSDLDLESFLETGQVTSIRPLGKGSTRPLLMEFRKGRDRVRGVCKNVEEEDDRYQHEIAAYRLDRALGLQLVPVTVLRTTGVNTPCSLQFFVEHALDAQAAREYGLPEGYRDAVRRLEADGRVFDALIGNVDRTPGDILHLPDEGRIALIDHSRAFSLETGLARWFGEEEPALSPEIEAALRKLDNDRLRAVLSGWLSRKQIRAVADRRDALLAAGSQDRD